MQHKIIETFDCLCRISTIYINNAYYVHISLYTRKTLDRQRESHVMSYVCCSCAAIAIFDIIVVVVIPAQRMHSYIFMHTIYYKCNQQTGTRKCANKCNCAARECAPGVAICTTYKYSTVQELGFADRWENAQ